MTLEVAVDKVTLVTDAIVTLHDTTAVQFAVEKFPLVDSPTLVDTCEDASIGARCNCSSVLIAKSINEIDREGGTACHEGDYYL